jgi:hypothetical protein
VFLLPGSVSFEKLNGKKFIHIQEHDMTSFRSFISAIPLFESSDEYTHRKCQAAQRRVKEQAAQERIRRASEALSSIGKHNSVQKQLAQLARA